MKHLAFITMAFLLLACSQNSGKATESSQKDKATTEQAAPDTSKTAGGEMNGGDEDQSLNDIRFANFKDADWLDNEYIRQLRAYINNFNAGKIEDQQARLADASRLPALPGAEGFYLTFAEDTLFEWGALTFTNVANGATETFTVPEWRDLYETDRDTYIAISVLVGAGVIQVEEKPGDVLNLYNGMLKGNEHELLHVHTEE